MTQPAMPAPTSAKLAAGGRPFRILVLDDELNMQRLMKVILESEGYQVQVTDDGKSALELLASAGPFDLIVQDIRMPKMDGLKFLQLVREQFPDVLSIVVTAFGTWETAVEAMRLGAYTHVSKPFDTTQFRQLVARALERKSLRASNTNRDFPLMDIVGFSPAVNAITTMIKRIAPTDTTVLIAGESGTGKELAARAIHYYSLRTTGPFVPVNCGAFTETLLESELFGHAKGSFTNAIADRKGLFESANQGTLFLDEIGEMSPIMQVKLLRVLESQTFRPVGSNKETRVDVRIIAATNRNLAQMCVEGGFREDLYHRLNVIPLALPALRERMEDVPLLAGHFLARYSKKMGKHVRTIDDAAMRLLINHNWPGNIRELENTVERSVALCLGDKIGAEDVVVQNSVSYSPPPPQAYTPPSPSAPLTRASGGTPSPFAQNFASNAQSQPQPSAYPPPRLPSTSPDTAGISSSMPDINTALPLQGMDLERYLLEVERGYIIQALERTDWNMTEAAKLLGMTFRSIRYRVSKLNIERPPR